MADLVETPFADAQDWLRTAARLFAERIGAMLVDHGSDHPEARLMGVVETGDARHLAQAIAAGPLTSPAEPPERAAHATRLARRDNLTDLRIGRLIALLEIPDDGILPLTLLCTVAHDARFARLLGWLNDDAQRRSLTPGLTRALCDGVDIDWTDSPLARLACITLQRRDDQVPHDWPLLINPVIATWLADDGPEGPADPALDGLLRPALPVRPDLLMPDGAIPSPTGPIALTGPDGSGRVALAAGVMLRQGIVAHRIDVADLTDPAQTLAMAVRDSTLSGRGLIVAGADALPRPLLRRLIDTAPCPLALTARDRLALEIPHHRLPDLDAIRIRHLWEDRLGTGRASEAGALAHQFRLPVDDLLAIDAGPNRSLPEIRRACLDRSSATLARMAAPVALLHDWDDLILPPRQMEALRSIVSRARHARAVFDDWGFGRKLVPNRGLSALLSGPSGAGKTLSASVVARAIGLPLYRVDLSATVSKYIGETEKNLETIFSAAEAGNACLLFDECDALFGKRSEVSDAHDRYANIETSYLLQRMEAHRGIVLMSSNHPQNIDDAFMRRIDLAIEFALPDAAQRMALWQRLMPDEAGAEIDTVMLGEKFELTGGSIRNCLVAAAFLAAEAGERLDTHHCVRAVALEYEKTRRPLTRAEFGEAYPALRARKGA